MRGWKWLLSFTSRLCYADSSSTHLCQVLHPLLFPLTHLLCIPSVCHFSHLSTCEPFSSSLCDVCSFHFTDHPTSSHSAVSVSHSAFLDDEEFSDFIQGPVEIPKLVPQPASQPFHSAAEAGQLLSEKAVLQPLPPAPTPVLSILHGTTGQVPYFPTSASSPNIHKTGNSKVSFSHVTFCRRATQSLYLFCWSFFQSG